MKILQWQNQYIFKLTEFYSLHGKKKNIFLQTLINYLGSCVTSTELCVWLNRMNTPFIKLMWLIFSSFFFMYLTGRMSNEWVFISDILISANNKYILFCILYISSTCTWVVHVRTFTYHSQINRYIYQATNAKEIVIYKLFFWTIPRCSKLYIWHPLIPFNYNTFSSRSIKHSGSLL